MINHVLFVTMLNEIWIIGCTAAPEPPEEINDPYNCICPGFKRVVSFYGPSGNIISYDNLCHARCVTKKYNVVGIGPRADVGDGIFSHGDHIAHPGVTHDEDDHDHPPSKKVTEQWLKEVKKESNVWKKVNGLLRELIHLSNGGGPRCTCPSLRRKACSFGPGGNIIAHDNICSQICHAPEEPNSAIGIGDFCNATSLSYNPRHEYDEEKELQKWYKFMEGEIQFYRKVGDAMSGFFYENGKTDALPSSYQYKQLRSNARAQTTISNVFVLLCVVLCTSFL